MRAARLTPAGYLAEILAEGLSLDAANRMIQEAAQDERGTLFGVLEDDAERPLICALRLPLEVAE